MRKTFIGSSDESAAYSKLLSEFYTPEPWSGPEPAGDEPGNDNFTAVTGLPIGDWGPLINRRAKLCDMYCRGEIVEDAEGLLASGHSEDRGAFLLGLTRDQYREWARLEDLDSLRAPDLAVHLTRELAVRLDGILHKLALLEDIQYREVVSEDLRVLFIEAHRCWLYGFEAASSIMCGAILEQAFKEALGPVSLTISNMVKSARAKGLIGDQHEKMALEVFEMRNKAAHSIRKFSKASLAMRATLLSNTRAVVNALYHPSVHQAYVNR